MKKKKFDKIKYTAYVVASIDGRIAKNGHSGIDWTSKEDWNFLQKSLTKMDAVIVGHNTYKVSEDHLKWRNAVVLTSKINKPKIQGKAILFNPKKFNLKIFLQSKNYKKVAVLGGSKAYDFCLRNQMIDELFVTIEPYVFTNGVPMFAGRIFKKYRFTLMSVKKLNKEGTILLHYQYGN